MLPIVLNSQHVKVGLAGAGEALERRASLLEGAGITPVYLVPGGALGGLSVLFVAGLDAEASQDFARRARSASILVNVEDVPDLCDFHVPALVRRGDLLLSISTGGRSPALARRLREWLEEHFGAIWSARLDELGEARDRWRAEGIGAGDIAVRVRRIIDEKGWLK